RLRRPKRPPTRPSGSVVPRSAGPGLGGRLPSWSGLLQKVAKPSAPLVGGLLPASGCRTRRPIAPGLERCRASRRACPLHPATARRRYPWPNLASLARPWRAAATVLDTLSRAASTAPAMRWPAASVASAAALAARDAAPLATLAALEAALAA